MSDDVGSFDLASRWTQSEVFLQNKEIFSLCKKMCSQPNERVARKCFNLTARELQLMQGIDLSDKSALAQLPILMFRPGVNLGDALEALKDKHNTTLPDGMIAGFDQADLPRDYIDMHGQYYLTIRAIVREAEMAAASFFTGLQSNEIEALQRASHAEVLNLLHNYVIFFTPRMPLEYISSAPDRGTTINRMVFETVACVLAAETPIAKLTVFK